MKKILLLFLLLFLPHLSTGAEVRTLEIELSFPMTEFPDKQLLGYRLFKEEKQVCETTDPVASTITCEFLTEDGTFNFTLTAFYSDNSQSPPSPSFPFTIGSAPPPTPSGNKNITYTWEARASSVELTGFQMYINSTLLCETDDPNTNTLTCTGDLINAPMTFSMKSVDINGTESLMSNFLKLDPADFPELFLNKKLVFSWEYTDDPTNIGGFRIFDNGELVCETPGSSIRQLACERELATGSHLFTMVAIDANGVETVISNGISYSSTSTTEPPPETATIPRSLQAIITPTPVTGVAPVNISFSGTDSIGNISTFTWLFGDGTTGTGSVVSHTYSSEGIYSATLRIANPTETIHETTTVITVLSNTTPPQPPVAILSSTTAAGNAPLQVDFDGSSSTTPNPPMLSFSWAFGDSSVATGEKTSHAFTIAGTYYTELTVADSLSLTDKIDTPVIVIGSVTENEPPNAIITASPTQGHNPLTVSFDGSDSFDPDGSITKYSWNFGDGTTGNGSTAIHTYSSTAVYTVSMQVTDNKGQIATTSKYIACTTILPEVPFYFEVGELSINHEWLAVQFEQNFTQPVIIVGPPTVSDAEPVLVRIRNVNQNSFEIRLQEWDYQDGIHAEELVSYFVMEQGQTSLPDGTKIEARVFTSGSSDETIPFHHIFKTPPIVLTATNSINSSFAAIGSVRNISNRSFTFTLQGQELARGQQITETVAYIAWQPGKMTDSDLLYEAAIATQSISQDWGPVILQSNFASLPFFFANTQTQNEQDPSTIRQQKLTVTEVELQVQEEQSQDDETTHQGEVVGYLAIGSKSSTTPADPTNSSDNDKKLQSAWDFNGAKHPDLLGIKRITYSWDFNAELEGTITGFRVYNNGLFVCDEPDSTARQTTCETATSSNNVFMIKALELSGAETTSSNAISYSP